MSMCRSDAGRKKQRQANTMKKIEEDAISATFGAGTSAQQLLPHRFGMLLLDEVVQVDETGITARAAVRHEGSDKEEGLFIVNGRMGAWVLIEYMAQTMAMWISWNARKAGKPVPVGFLLGTRRLDLAVDDLMPGEEVLIRAEPVYVSEEDRLAQFSCSVLSGGRLVASAKLNAFEPEDPSTFAEAFGA